MKLATRFLFALLPTALLAGVPTPPHSAFGPITFGMERNKVSLTEAKLGRVREGFGGGFSAAEVRKYFVTGTMKKMPRLAVKDATIPVWLRFEAHPVISEVAAYTMGDNHIEKIKDRWLVFQDIGESKFSRVGAPVAFPAEADFSDEKPSIITDVWEAGGIRIELSVRRILGVPGTASPTTNYQVFLTAFEVNPAPQQFPVAGAK